MQKTTAPKVIFIMGLPGSGKTFLAKHLAQAINAVHLSSDAVRNKINKRGHYRPEDKQQVYDTMLKELKKNLEKNQTVVVDSTFYQQQTRQHFLEVAKAVSKEIFWIMTTADEPTIKKRVSKKRPDSEADFKIYLLVKQNFEAVNFDYLEIKTDQLSLEENLQTVKKYCGITL